MNYHPNNESKVIGPEQLELIKQMWDTLSIQEIADVIGVSVCTIRYHIRKLGLKDNAANKPKQRSCGIHVGRTYGGANKKEYQFPMCNSKQCRKRHTCARHLDTKQSSTVPHLTRSEVQICSRNTEHKFYIKKLN